MDIAALATTASQTRINNQASILVMKKAMDTASDQSQGLLALMSTATPSISLPHLGNNIDISV